MSTPQNLPALIKEMQERAKQQWNTKFGYLKNSHVKGAQLYDHMMPIAFIQQNTTDTANATLEYVKGVIANDKEMTGCYEGCKCRIRLLARLTSNPE